jgi:hypothetical protein
MEIPFEINYNITVPPPQITNQNIESWQNITYNDHFMENAEDIIKSRFPCGDLDHIPGMIEVFKTMALNLKVTPLTEWDKRSFINNHQN